jgi:hypothetical protein
MGMDQPTNDDRIFGLSVVFVHIQMISDGNKIMQKIHMSEYQMLSEKLFDTSVHTEL